MGTSCKPWMLVAGLVLSCVNAPTAKARTLPARDECTSLSGFTQFRARLEAAVARRDTAFLLSIVDPKITFNFGGGSGQAAFAWEWKLKGREPSPIWQELAQMLLLGCASDEGTASMPYLFSRFPDDLDAFEGGVVVVKPGARLWTRPNARPTLTIPLWTVIEQSEVPGERESWRKVTLPGGRSGFARNADVRSPIDYRVIFERRKGRWVMTSFIAGD